jgi:hypothetical protein
MHKHQYDALCAELGTGDYGAPKAREPCMVYITTGRQKGKLGVVLLVDHGKLMVQAEAARPITYAYTKVERIDGNGDPIVLHALDITGRPVTGTSVVCYSVNCGPQSHGLEIGRVIKTNPSGTLVVQPIIRNGTRLVSYNGGTYRARSMVRADRVILLPVDTTLVTTWVLSGFEVYRADALLT